jgi:hypothetical protein
MLPAERSKRNLVNGARALYTITFLVNVILIRNLERYRRLPKTMPIPRDEAETPPTAAASGFERHILRVAATGSYSRATARNIEV